MIIRILCYRGIFYQILSLLWLPDQISLFIVHSAHIKINGKKKILMQVVENLMIPDVVLNSELLLRTVELLSDGQVGDVSFDQTITVGLVITGSITTTGEYN